MWGLYLQSVAVDGETDTRSTVESGESDPCGTYDRDGSGVLEDTEVAEAIEDHFGGELSRDDIIIVLSCYFANTTDYSLVWDPCAGPEGCWWLTATAVAPTATPITPTATPVTPTATPVTPTATPVTPTATPIPASSYLSADPSTIEVGDTSTVSWC